MELITGKTISAAEISDVVEEVFRESASDDKRAVITYSDFHRVLGPTDFHTKLHLPI